MMKEPDHQETIPAHTLSRISLLRGTFEAAVDIQDIEGRTVLTLTPVSGALDASQLSAGAYIPLFYTRGPAHPDVEEAAQRL